MYIYEKYDFSMFYSRFKDYKRHDQFSIQGLRALYKYLSEIAEDSMDPIELDVITLYCDYSEDTLEYVLNYYELDSIEELRDNTVVLELDNGNVLYENY